MEDKSQPNAPREIPSNSDGRGEEGSSYQGHYSPPPTKEMLDAMKFSHQRQAIPNQQFDQNIHHQEGQAQLNPNASIFFNQQQFVPQGQQNQSNFIMNQGQQQQQFMNQQAHHHVDNQSDLNQQFGELKLSEQFNSMKVDKNQEYYPIQNPQQSFMTPTKDFKEGGHFYSQDPNLMPSEFQNQQMMINLVPKPIQNTSKIPQSAQIPPRKISVTYEPRNMQSHIYYQEGNQEQESVDVLTDMKDPSEKSSIFNQKLNDNINDLLNDEEVDISAISSQNKLKTSFGESLENDTNLIQSFKRGHANSLDRNTNIKASEQLIRPNQNFGQQAPTLNKYESPLQDGRLNQDYHKMAHQNNEMIQQFQPAQGQMNQYIPQHHSKPQQSYQNQPDYYNHQYVQQPIYYQPEIPQHQKNFIPQYAQPPQPFQPPIQQQIPAPDLDAYNQLLTQNQLLSQQNQVLQQMNTHQIRIPGKVTFGPGSAEDNKWQGENSLSDQSAEIQLFQGQQIKKKPSFKYSSDAGNRHDISEKEEMDFMTGVPTKSRLKDWKVSNQGGTNSNQNVSTPITSNQRNLVDVGDIKVECEDYDRHYTNKSGQNKFTKNKMANPNPYNNSSQQKTYQNKMKSRGGAGIYDSDSYNGSGGSGSNERQKQGSLNSKESQDAEFMHQIQHDMKLANEDPDEEFKVLEGHIITLAKKKVGSRFLQNHLSNAKQALINKIIDQIDGHLADLMTDNYGNYFCSELIQYLQVHQRVHFLRQIKGQKFMEISCNNRGTWALQTIIYSVTEEEEFDLIKETLLQNNNITKLSRDNQGQHMIQKIIKTFSEQRREYIFENILTNFYELATDKQGLCVMKKLIECTHKAESQKKIVNKIIEKCGIYVQNEFGNFVVSEVLQQFKTDVYLDIFNSIMGSFVKLSQNKYSSKFIENCIQRAPLHVQKEILSEFINSNELYKVVESNFGNYVLQNSLDTYCTCEQTRFKLISSIIHCLSEVSEYKLQQKWGNEILMKFIKQMSPNACQELTTKVNDVMAKATNKYKSQKQQVTLQMQRHSNNEYKNKNFSGGSSNQDNRTYCTDPSEDYRYGTTSNHADNGSHFSSPQKFNRQQQQQSGRAYAHQDDDYYNHIDYNNSSNRKVTNNNKRKKNNNNTFKVRENNEKIIISEKNIQFAKKD